MLRRGAGIEIGRTAATYTCICFQKYEVATRWSDKHMAETVYSDGTDEINTMLTVI